MLTIEEIKEISFRRSGRSGYNAIDVDEFIDGIVATVEQLSAEKADLERKLEILAAKVEEYRSDEETVRNALISSQRISDATLREAKNKAAFIIKAAEKKSRDILTEAEMATEREKDKFEALHNETAKLRKEIIATYKKHLTAVEELPTDEDVQKKRRELDEKYPFQPAEDLIKVEEEPVAEDFDVEESAPEVTETKEEASAPKHIKPDSTNEKFEELKFGDNYDVE